MDESKIHDHDHLIAYGNNGLFLNANEFWGFGCKSNVMTSQLFDLLKGSMLKLAVNGADIVFKDQKLLKRKRGFGENWEEDLSSNSENYWVCDSKSISQENERVCAKPDCFSLIESSNKKHSPSGGYNEFPLNFLSFLAIMMAKIVGFQFSLAVKCFTFPIWLSYFSFIFLMFPFQTLRHIRGHLMKKLLRMFGTRLTNVTSFVSELLNDQISIVKLARRFGWALFWSIYVCSILFGLLASAFVVGSFMMQRVLEKPIQSTENLNFDYTKTSPVALVPIMSSQIVDNYSGLVSNDNAEARKHVRARVIPHNHKLQLTVSLTMPESDYNLKLGVFQVRIEFLSANGKVTSSSSYPCMLRFKSQSIRLAETILRSVPLIAGFQSESQMLNIKMNEFTEGIEPTACLKITLQQRAQLRPGAGIPEIYAASLMLESELPRLKRIIWYWRRTILVWVSIVTYLAELVFVFVFCRPLIVPRGKAKLAYGKKDSHSNSIPWYKSSYNNSFQIFWWG